MTPESTHRIEALETRVERIEDTTRTDIVAIHNKLDGLATLLNQALVAGAKQACPSPGACINLARDLEHAMKILNANTLRVERLELELIKLNQQKAWVTGAWAAVVLIASALGGIASLLISKLWK